MVRRVEVIVGKTQTNSVQNCLKSIEFVHALTIVRGERTDLLMFRCKEKHVRQVVYQLGELGVGINYGVIDVVNLQMTKPRMFSKRKKQSAWSTTERQTIEEMYEIVDGALHLTFDYLAFTFVAAIISAVGLMTDSSVTVVASMLVSPLMGPILGISFGYLIGDSHMMLKSLRNEVAGMTLCFIVGMICACFSMIDPDLNTDMNSQMASRATAKGLIAGAVVAAPSGIGVALSVANTNINSLVGVAISAALLPPIVNSAILLVYGFRKSYFADRVETDYYSGSLYSMALFLMNWVLIFVFSMITFHVKGLRRDELSIRPRWRGSAFVNSETMSLYYESVIDDKDAKRGVEMIPEIGNPVQTVGVKTPPNGRGNELKERLLESGE